VYLIHTQNYFDAIFRVDYGFGITKNGTQGLVIGVGQYFSF
jgi:FMN-dependent NADH-azoreductase